MTRREVTEQELIREMPKGLLKWYAFEEGGSALYVSGGQAIDGVMAEALTECGLLTECCMPDIECSKKYDYIVITTAMEQTGGIDEAAKLLTKMKWLLKEDGRIFLGMGNRLAIRGFCGDRDKYTGRNFDGIENYIGTGTSVYDRRKGRCYAKAEIKEMLHRAGFMNYCFFSVFPALERPQILFADDYLPNEQLDIRIFPQYNDPETVFLEEEKLYDTLIQNNLFHTMANAFWIECRLQGQLSNVDQVTMSMDRGRTNAMFTIIRKDGWVEKKPVYEEGRYKIDCLAENSAYLEKHDVDMVKMRREHNTCLMPYVKAQSALEYLRNVLAEDKNSFLGEIDKLWTIILNSSEHVPYEAIDWDRFEPGWETRSDGDPLKEQWKKMAMGSREEKDRIGVILKRGYIDLIPLNAFYKDGAYLFFDQELYVENLPAKVILLRTIDTVYLGNRQLERILPAAELKERYGLLDCKPLFYKFTNRFLNELRNDRILKEYHTTVRGNLKTIYANRQRMNYSAEEYDRIFRDIFRGTEGRSLYLFGSGQFAQAFLSQFGRDYEIAGIIDNDPDKWNGILNGITVRSPECLQAQEKGTFKVIICIKNYMSVMEQLKKMGIQDFSVYDMNLTYIRAKTAIKKGDGQKVTQKKKYNVGYIAGVFDLFHIGHLNLLRRAKEECNYLIVGIVTDEGVIKQKHTTPMIPFEERIEIVRACRYVDEAVEIPFAYYDSDEAYRRYQFDVQFAGSDYANSKGWAAKKEYLQKRGSDLVFFPYTESISSTQIKRQIKEGGNLS